MTQKKIKPTKTSDFLLPLLGYSKSFYTPYLYNAYLGDKDVLGYVENDIYVLMKYNGSQEFLRLEEKLQKHPNFRTSYDILNGTYTFFVITMPKIFHSDYEKFLKGQYSKFSGNARTLLLKGRSKDSSLLKVLDRHADIRRYWEHKLNTIIGTHQEVWSVPILEDEIFNVELFKKENNIVFDPLANKYKQL